MLKIYALNAKMQQNLLHLLLLSLAIAIFHLITVVDTPKADVQNVSMDSGCKEPNMEMPSVKLIKLRIAWIILFLRKFLNQHLCSQNCIKQVLPPIFRVHVVMMDIY